jgi:hypothetical protein
VSGEVLQELQGRRARHRAAAVTILNVNSERDIALVADEPGVRLRRVTAAVFGRAGLRHHRAAGRGGEHGCRSGGHDLAHQGVQRRENVARQRRRGRCNARAVFRRAVQHKLWRNIVAARDRGRCHRKAGRAHDRGALAERLGGEVDVAGRHRNLARER